MARFAIETIFSAVDRITAPVSRMQNRVGRMTRGISRGLADINDATGRLTAGLVGVGKAAAIGIAAPIGAALAGITAINAATAQTDALARAQGTTGRNVSLIAGALRETGLEAEDVTDLFEELNNKMGESKGLEEIGPVTESLTILGLKFKDIKNLSPEKQVEAIANAGLKLDDVQKAIGATDIFFGNKASVIFGSLSKKGASLEEATKRVKELSFITNRGTAGALLYGKAVNESTFFLTSLGKEISGLAGEKLAPLIEMVTEAAIKNKELINQKLIEFFENMAVQIKWLIENFGLVVDRIKAVGRVIGIFFAMSLALKAVAVAMGVVNFVVGLNKFVIIGVAIAGLIALIIDLTDQWDLVAAVMLVAFDKIGAGVTWVKGLFVDFLST